MPGTKGNKNAVGNKGGRPEAWKPEYVKMAQKIALLGATDEDLARIFDVSIQTIYNWKTDHVEFVEALKKGKDEADANVASRLYQRALGYEHDEIELKVVSDGGNLGSHVEQVKVRKIYPPDPVACIFWLKNRQPGKWRDRIDHTSGDKPFEAPIIIVQPKK